MSSSISSSDSAFRFSGLLSVIRAAPGSEATSTFRYSIPGAELTRPAYRRSMVRGARRWA